MFAPWKKSYGQPRQHIIKQRHYFVNKVWLVKAMVFPVVMYGCESWTIKKAECWRIHAFEFLLEKTPESPLECKDIKPVNPKGNQSWILIGRTDAEAKTPIPGPPDAKNWLIGIALNAGKDWRGDGDDRGWDGWMASPTRWTWVWAGSRSWWWTGRPLMLQSMVLQRVGHDWHWNYSWN